MSADHDFEAVPGLPAELPPGESIVWQGRPEWMAFARHTFKIRWLAAYFGVFLAARLVLVIQERQGGLGLLHLLGLAGLAAACLGVLAFIAWLNARATMYTITTRRIVLRIGVALPMTWNLPFKRLASADVKLRAEGDGDITLQLVAPDRIAWLHLWPHVQPGHYLRARPTLRTLAEPARVAALLAEAVKAWSRSAAAPVLMSPAEAYAEAVAPAPAAVHVGASAAPATH